MRDPTTERAHVNGIDMEFRHWPAPLDSTHPPVVILHGVLQTGEGMRHLAEKLALDGEVVVPDLRGRGGTSQPDVGYDPETMAQDVGELIEHLDIGPAVVIGRLHGGVLAYRLAARRPELVKAIVLGDASPEISDDRAASILSRIQSLPHTFSSRDHAEAFYERDLLLSPARIQNDLPIDLEKAENGTYRWRYNLNIIKQIAVAALPRSDWDVLMQVTCPVLILRGQRGLLRPETAERMIETIPNARSQTILGAGYDVFLGPGSEQTLAAIKLFLCGMNGDD